MVHNSERVHDQRMSFKSVCCGKFQVIICQSHVNLMMFATRQDNSKCASGWCFGVGTLLTSNVSPMISQIMASHTACAWTHNLEKTNYHSATKNVCVDFVVSIHTSDLFELSNQLASSDFVSHCSSLCCNRLAVPWLCDWQLNLLGINVWGGEAAVSCMSPWKDGQRDCQQMTWKWQQSHDLDHCKQLQLLTLGVPSTIVVVITMTTSLGTLCDLQLLGFLIWVVPINARHNNQMMRMQPLSRSGCCS